MSDAICSLPPVEGTCRGKFDRFFFNTTTLSCQKFIYTGCQGNRNNFLSVEECKRSCIKNRKTENVNPCELKVEKGNCKKKIVNRFYHETSTKSCKKFKYTGCGGNANNFKSIEECQKTCRSQNVCELKVDPGPCKGAFVKYYYNSATGVCKKFIYGGCEGNGNNFRTWIECSKTCHDPCRRPAKKGPCRSSLTRFFYNSAKGQCERFTFGGCGGNRNNFVTLKDCKKTCLKTKV